jgi:translation elongation factor EF-4
VKIASIEEPWIKATILTPDDYLGAILKLCQERRGIQTDLTYAGSAPWWSTSCRSTRWCSTSTTG